jgi:signal transduction histidine kinase
MKKIFIAIQFFFLVNFAQAQILSNTDSLKNSLAQEKDDSKKFKTISELFWSYVYINPDSSFRYAQEGLLLAQKLKDDKALYYAYGQYASFERINGNYPEATKYVLQYLAFAKQTKNFVNISSASIDISDIYREEGDYEHAIYYANIATSLFMSNFAYDENAKISDTLIAYGHIILIKAEIYEQFNQLDSALKYATFIYENCNKIFGIPHSPPAYVMGNIYSKIGKFHTAFDYYRQGLAIAINTGLTKDIMDIYNGMAKTFKKTGQFDSTIFYAKKTIELSQTAHYSIVKLDALSMLSEIYRSQKNIDSLARYLDLTIAAKDSLFSQQKVMQVQSLTFNEQLSQQELQQKIEQNAIRYKNRLNIYILFASLLILLIVAAALWRRNIYRKKSYTLLQTQNQEIDNQKQKVESALEELKATQSQLIQSEKMASLGVLTAGIAHEIQNPLNFVNNFSEVNRELLKEMNEEIENGNLKEVKSIAKDVSENEEKINHHGKRADAIVKGMLQHSRSRSGIKELTDINKLADEYLRLAYHGLRAKDKSFNATMVTHFDPTIEKVNLVPQDIGRVILNLITNAFYVVNEKKKNELGGYEPTVTINTTKSAKNILISVRDNGNGIPKNILDKIFQPFFTTKPTGQGTGLGLSLSYDIVKAHGGDLRVVTKEGEGSEFIIQIPVN